MRGFSSTNKEEESSGFMSFLKVASETDEKKELESSIEAAEIEMNLGDIDIGFEKEGNLEANLSQSEEALLRET